SPLTDGAQHVLVRPPNEPRDAALAQLQHQLDLPLGVLVRVPFSLRILDLYGHVPEVLVIRPAVEWLVCVGHPVSAEFHEKIDERCLIAVRAMALRALVAHDHTRSLTMRDTDPCRSPNMRPISCCFSFPMKYRSRITRAARGFMCR